MENYEKPDTQETPTALLKIYNFSMWSIYDIVYSCEKIENVVKSIVHIRLYADFSRTWRGTFVVS